MSPHRIEVPSDTPLPAGSVILDEKDSADVSGITVKGPVADQARLISQFGVPTVIQSVFLVLLISSLWFFRSDSQAQIRLQIDANDKQDVRHRDEIVTITESQERKINAIAKQFEAAITYERDERREDRKHILGALQNLTAMTKTGNEILMKTSEEHTRAADLLAKQLSEMQRKGGGKAGAQ